MRAKDRKYFKKKLLEKKSELVSIVQKTESYGRELASDGEAMDIADKASSSYTKEFIFNKSDGDRQLLQQVVNALERVDGKDYGECSKCEEPVERKRLEAVPWASLCLSCQEEAEQTP
ncbi:MAG: TraR/DksA C4-type zinc finger protein [Acidobacteriota bacterium]